MKSRTKILLTILLATCFTMMIAAPAMALAKADYSGFGKGDDVLQFGDALTGNRLPAGGALIGDDFRLGGGSSGNAEPDDLNCPGEDGDDSGIVASFPPDDVNDGQDNPNNPGGSEENEPPKIIENNEPGQPVTTTTPQTPPPSTSVESGKLPNTGTQLILAGAVGLVIILVAYGARRAVTRRVR
ncbi:MAG: hypothetical protein WC911_05790 [Thermoleophilia bacterium]